MIKKHQKNQHMRKYQNNTSFSVCFLSVAGLQIQTEVIQTFDFNNLYENVEFITVLTYDQYRKGYPYKVFHYPGRSKVNISFVLEDTGTMGPISVIASINHCATNCKGVVDMYMNNVPFLTGYGGARWDNFEEQTFRIPGELCFTGVNVFTICLNAASPGVYWLSDARLGVERCI